MPSSSSAAASSGSTPKQGGIGEGRVQEVHRAQVGPLLGQHPPEQREVVVLHEHGVALARPCHDHVGHGPVVGPVALPGGPPVAVEAGPVRQVEEVVMDVPQRRVGDDVVGLPVGVVVDHDRDEVEPVLGHEPPGDGLAVGRPHRHRGPRRAAAREEPVQRGGQPARRRRRHERAVGPRPEAERAAVGDDDGPAHGSRQRRRGDALEGGPQHVDGLGPQLVQGAVAVDALAQVDLGQALRPEGPREVDQQPELDAVARGEAELLEDPAVAGRLAGQRLAHPRELGEEQVEQRAAPRAR